MLLRLIFQALAIVVLAVLCHGTGRAILARLPCESRGLRAVVATGLGFGMFGQALFAIALLGALTRPVVLTLLVLMALPAARYAPELGRLIRDTPLALSLVLAWGSLPAFLRALYPPTGFDATMYHLTYARLFAEAGSLVWAGTLRFPVFPQLNEMLFAAALLVAGDVTAQLTQWLCFVIVAATAGVAARSLRDERAALLAVAIWCAVPLATFLGSNAYIDAGLTMAITLAFAAWAQWRATGHPGWAALTGAFAGMAAATKYNGLLFVPIIGFALLASSRRRFRDGALYVLAAGVVAAPWYLHIAAETGNPVFPYLGSIFGPNEWQFGFDASLHAASLFLMPTLQEWLLRNVYDLRPWLLVLIPLAAAGAVIERRCRFFFLCALASVILLWRFDTRFMIVVLPLLAICGAIALRRWSRATAVLVVVLLLPVTLWEARGLLSRGRPPQTAAERDAFLAARVWPYAALRFIEATGGAHRTVYTLDGPNGSYFWSGRYLGELVGPYRYALVEPWLRQPDRLGQVLRSFGAEYFIVRPGVFDPGPSGAFERVYASADAEVFCIRYASRHERRPFLLPSR